MFSITSINVWNSALHKADEILTTGDSLELQLCSRMVMRSSRIGFKYFLLGNFGLFWHFLTESTIRQA